VEDGVVRLLCATDLQARSDFAVERAGYLADVLGADLSLMHVVGPTESERVLEQTLQIAIAQLRARAHSPLWRWVRTPNVIVRAGSPARLVAEVAQRRKARLLVVGPHRKRGILEAFDGSITDRVLRSRVCPVLVVQKQPTAEYRNILLGLDSTAPSIAALKAAEALFLRPGTAATVVHAYEPVFRRLPHAAGNNGVTAGVRLPSAWRMEAETAMRDLLKWQSRDFSRFGIEVEEGKPADVVLGAAEASRTDLIVVGTRAPGRLHRALTGSVAKQILGRARCDVLIVPEAPVLSGAAREETPAIAATKHNSGLPGTVTGEQGGASGS
jgi:nucleotide-binding universal stress UspA family protein